MKKSGIVVLCGRPNTGKSTLLNLILKEKIAPVTSKPQTTRKNLKGIYNDERGQIVLVDSPGIHDPIHKLGEKMVKYALNILKEGDVLLWVVDGSVAPTDEDLFVSKNIKDVNKPKILAINKRDLFEGKEAEVIKRYESLGDFKEIIPVSALRGDNVEKLLDILFSYLPEGEPLYPEDMLTDSMEIEIVAELIREKILLHTKEEVPHSVAVIVEEFKERENGKVYIRANIYVERDSQKKILIGYKGHMLKIIGTEARMEIEKFLRKPVYLELWVKVYKNWRKKEEALKYLDFK